MYAAGVDLEAFEAVHAGEWAELDALVRRRRLTGAETDRLVTLYQRTATHLSQVRSAAPDPVLVGRLSTLVARARGRLTGSGESAWRDVAPLRHRVVPGGAVPDPLVDGGRHRVRCS